MIEVFGPTARMYMVSRDIHNVATGCEHMGDRGAAGEVHAPQVDIDDVIKILDSAFIRIFSGLRGSNNARVADDDVNSIHFACGVVNKTFDLCGLADIGNLGIDKICPLTKFFGDFNHARIFVANADRSTRFRQGFCYCISKSVGRACNESFAMK